VSLNIASQQPMMVHMFPLVVNKEGRTHFERIVTTFVPLAEYNVDTAVMFGKYKEEVAALLQNNEGKGRGVNRVAWSGSGGMPNMGPSRTHSLAEIVSHGLQTAHRPEAMPVVEAILDGTAGTPTKNAEAEASADKTLILELTAQLEKTREELHVAQQQIGHKRTQVLHYPY
jgi:hypothetical protein